MVACGVGMGMKVKLDGGPADGRVIDIPDPYPTILVPVAEDPTAAPRLADQSVPMTQVRSAEYVATGMRTIDGLPIYTTDYRSFKDLVAERFPSFRHQEGFSAWGSERYPRCYIPNLADPNGDPEVFCGYCHGRHEDEVELMHCQKRSEEIESSEEFWLPGEVVGYRGFRIVEEGVPDDPTYALKGVKQIWPEADPGPAKCIPATPFEHPDRKDHEAPMVACMCGYYLLKEADDVGIWDVHAVVKGWGKVIEHEKGYRTERARIVAIHSGKSGGASQGLRAIQRARVEAVAERYGVELWET